MCNELSDQEVWLKVYCAELTRTQYSTIRELLIQAANNGVEDFRRVFPKKAPTPISKPPRPPTPPGPRKVSGY